MGVEMSTPAVAGSLTETSPAALRLHPQRPRDRDDCTRSRRCTPLGERRTKGMPAEENGSGICTSYPAVGIALFSLTPIRYLIIT